jgi:protein-tyrosine-phosphatase
MERYDDALADFDRAIELDPEYAWLTVERGETYRLMERYDDALADFNRAIELDPDQPWAIGRRGETYRLMERYDDALADFNRAIELDPSDDGYAAARAEIHRLMGKAEDALLDIPHVLFVCTQNDGRSQMAAALLDHQAAGRVRVASAGSQPADQLNPAVVQAIAEIGLDISAELPKPLTTGKVQSADVVITMGCGDVCPVFPGKRYLDWNLPDPAGLDLEAIRPIRDEIGFRVQQLLAELTSPLG